MYQQNIKLLLFICSLSFIAILNSGCSEQNNSSSTDSGNDFFELKNRTGVNFSNDITETYATFFEFFPNVYNGGGVASGDVNNDGLIDLFFSGNQVEDKLYINKGDFKFKDISKKAGINKHGWSNGATMVDVNQDGWLDIYVARGGFNEIPSVRQNVLYINNQDGTFTEKAEEYGLADQGYSMHTVFFDMDNDNDLDMYLMNRASDFYIPLSDMYDRNLNPPLANTDKLFMNDGNHNFIDVSEERGIKNYSYSLGIVAGDINNDGWTDIFIANDFSTPDILYMNKGNGYFENKVDEAMNHISLYSMGVDLADFNNDLMEDYMVMEMRSTDYIRSKVSMPSMDVAGFNAIVDAGMHKQYMHNMLHMNIGDTKFSEVSQLCGVAKTDWSWSSLFYDFNNDGLKDIYVTNGIRRDPMNGDSKLKLQEYVEKNKGKFENPEDLFGDGFEGIINSYNPVKLPNYLYLNKGNFNFELIDSDGDLGVESFSNGCSVADLDNDGDLDIIVNNIEDKAFILENKSTGKNWTKINLKGPAKNQSGLGAKVYLYTAEGNQFFQQKTTRGYLSSQSPIIHFGLNNQKTIDSIVVVWQDQLVTKITQPEINTELTIAYEDAVRTEIEGTNAKPLFANVSDKVLNHKILHEDNQVNEFAEQVLLPHEFSKSGPKLALADINKDGINDFYLAGSRGKPGKLFLSSGGSKWIEKQMPAFENDKDFEDSDAVFIDYDADGDLDLFVASGGSDMAEGNPLYQNRLYRNTSNSFSKADFPSAMHNSSKVLSGDFDNDGDDDLFVGGFVKANTYPQSESSSFFRNDNGKFVDVTDEWFEDKAEGIVFDAIFEDLDYNGQAELVIVGEWMPVTVLSYVNGKFKDLTSDFGLASTVGWWNSVKSVDLDNDGKLDLVLGNLGENYKFKSNDKNKFKVFANDFDENGTYDVFLANEKDNKLLPVRGKECSSQQMPIINEKFPTFNEFAHAELNDILGSKIESSINFNADILSSIILKNNGGSFSIMPLPKEAQLSALSCIAPFDFDKDGKMDLLVGGNRFDTEVETTPSDASPGFLLLNKGNFEFEAIYPRESGLYLSGNVKDIELIKTKDKLYILASENKGPLSFYEMNNDQSSIIN